MSEPPPDNTSKFLSVAVQHRLLSQADAERVSQLVTQRAALPQHVALEEGLLDAVEVDIVDTLTNQSQAVPGYEVLGLLGRGGMGVVFRARQVNLDREVALKTLLLSQITQREALGRFEQEARTIGKLQHPHIVTAYDFGKHRGRFYLTMELVPGVDLGHFLRRHGRLSEQLAWQLARQIATGLAYAFRVGIVHRDIKPANVLVVADSETISLTGGAPLVKISDFGLSMLTTPAELQTRLTQPGRVVGTPNFMAPEQLCDHPLDLRTDIYALGATVFNLLAGEPPFSQFTMSELMSRKLTDATPNLSELEGASSEPTRSLLRDMLQPNPQERLDDYRELIERIDEIVNQPGAISASPLTPTVAYARDVKPVQPSTATKTTRFAQFLLAMLVTLAVIMFAWSAFLAWQRHTRPTPQAMVPGGAQVWLFNGESLAGWRAGTGQAGVATDSEGARVLELSGEVASSWEFPANQRSDRYRLSLGVALAEAENAELRFAFVGRPPQGRHLAIRVEGDRVLLIEQQGATATIQGQLTALQVPLVRDRLHYHSLRVDRQAAHWWAYFDNVLIGHAPAHSGERQQCVLAVEPGTALFESILVEELVPASN